MQPIPQDVKEWIRKAFRECNERITEKLSNNPNLPEESLDLTWIEHLSQYASPVTLGSSWTIKIETHYLGGLRQKIRLHQISVSQRAPGAKDQRRRHKAEHKRCLLWER